MQISKEKIYPAYVSKHNSNRQKQLIFLRIPNKEKLWHYLAVKKPPLSSGIFSEHYGDFYYLSSFLQDKESHKKVHENKDICNVSMPSEDSKLLEFNQYQNLTKYHLLFMHILNVQKRLMDVKIIQKIHLQQKSLNIFHQVFQNLQNLHL